MTYVQQYDRLGPLLTTFMAALPVLTLFYLLVIRRTLVPWAAASGAAAAFLVAVLVYAMPVHMAALAFLNGALFGLMPICWTIASAMLLYNITVETGRFERIKN